MTNNVRSIKIAGVSIALAGIIAVAAFLFSLARLPAQERNVPDHGSFTDCRMCHAAIYKMWETTGHSKTDPVKKENSSPVSCVVCHKPGSGDHPKQLVSDPEKLCNECHTQRAVLEGKGARGIEDVRSFHSAVTCVSCHMSEANHDMKLFRPNDPSIAENRLDTCTRCHKDNNRKMRAKQLTDWHEFYEEAINPIEKDMAAISAATKANPGALNADLKAKLDAINFNLEIIKKDGSRGAHNLDFALEIMATVVKDIKEIKAVIK